MSKDNKEARFRALEREGFNYEGLEDKIASTTDEEFNSFLQIIRDMKAAARRNEHMQWK